MPTPQSTEPETRRDPLREALSTGMADALTKDWPGDTRLQTAPAIVDYLLALPAVRAALASSTPDALDVEALLTQLATGPVPTASVGRPEHWRQGVRDALAAILAARGQQTKPDDSQALGFMREPWDDARGQQ